MHSLQPASASRTFSPFACYADQHTNGVHALQHQHQPQPQPQPQPQLLSLQLPHPWFEAGSVAGTPREATVADSSYGWASDTAAAVDGDSADGASPHGRAGAAAGSLEFGGVANAVLALQATGGDLYLCICSAHLPCLSHTLMRIASSWETPVSSCEPPPRGGPAFST